MRKCLCVILWSSQLFKWNEIMYLVGICYSYTRIQTRPNLPHKYVTFFFFVQTTTTWGKWAWCCQPLSKCSTSHLCGELHKLTKQLMSLKFVIIIHYIFLQIQAKNYWQGIADIAGSTFCKGEISSHCSPSNVLVNN